ncbi:MAG: S-layer homology domain-containing protein [Oscillospiraceae bacterium]|nr:S-layer homology domain-containing protein [Oscillospiraceae bacterium]
MKRIVGLLLALVLVLTVFPVTAQANEMMDGEDPILDYGSIVPGIESQSVELMSSAAEETFEMADIPADGKYQTMSTSQEMIDVIKDFEGFRSKAYWDNSQWTVGYGTRASGSDVTVTRAEAERLLRKALADTYEPIVNDFCKKNGKQPTQQQFDALLDLTYNAGGSWTTGSSVPDAVLNSVTALDLVKGFGAWSRSGGSVSYVHVNRRIREALIYLYGEYYLAYGNQDCKSDLEVVGNDDLPHFKVVIFKTNSGKLSNGKTDYAAYYPVGDYYRAFVDATRSGYTLVGWKITKRSNDSVSDGERISIWDTVEENLELTAVWESGTFEVEPEKPPVDYEEPAEPTEPEPTEPEMEQMPSVEIDMDRLPFSDVPENAWFRDAVSYVYRNEFMNGTSSTTFNPNGAMTRGMLVTVLYRIDGAMPVTDAERACFNDIGGAYYTDAVAWAYANGIVNGVTANTFAPDRIVTRQEAVTIFYRYCVDYSMAGVDSDFELNGFADREHVAGFAMDAFTWAVATGLVEGSQTKDGYCLNPTGNLNRAQAATLLQRCVEDIM